MTRALSFDDALAALRAKTPPDAETLRGAGAHAAELAPLVAEALRRRNAGAFLVPAEENLVRFGLAVAAGRAELAAPFFELIGKPHGELAGLLQGDLVGALLRLALAFAKTPEGMERVLSAATQPGGEPEPRAAMLLALARLLAEGKAPRLRTLAAFERVADGLTAADDPLILAAWLDAAALIGRLDWRERAERLFSLSPSPARVGDLEEWTRQAEASEAEEGFARFDAAGVAAFADPAEALDWTAPDPAPAPAGLDGTDAVWLADYLAWRGAEEAESWSLEAVDGFLVARALVAGPPEPEMLELLGFGAEADGTEADYARALLRARAEALRGAHASGAQIAPIVQETHALDLGRDFAFGFLEAVDLDADGWGEIWTDAVAEPAMAALRALEAAQDDELSAARRRALVEALPETIAAISRFWREPLSRRARAPVRSLKVGRNDPCPCGSGKKHKKCCGAGSAA